jgi:integrase
MSWYPCQEKSNQQKRIDKSNVARYLNACKNVQLKTALHVIASNGPRPIEICAVRECDVNLDSDPATIAYAAEYSKMRVARTRPLTREGLVVLSDDDDSTSSEGGRAAVETSSSLLSLDFGLSIACGVELESVGSDDDSD